MEYSFLIALDYIAILLLTEVVSTDTETWIHINTKKKKKQHKEVADT